MKIKIEKIDEKSEHLETVIRLGDENNATLGFLPKAAFVQSARKKQILVAIGENIGCLGYLLFREVKTKQVVSITHLCVDRIHRGKGIAKKLVDELIRLTPNWRGIILNSRRDYESNRLWEHLGFVYISEKIGRGKDNMPLTCYWYDHQHPNLLTLADKRRIQEKTTQAILDANVVYALYEDPTHPLLADWLLNDIVFCITPELANEINRQENGPKRRKMLNYARTTYPQIGFDRQKFEYSHEIIKSNYPQGNNRPQHESDLKHVAYAIAGNAEFFITQDEQLISNLADDVFSEFGLKIVRPFDLIIHLDELVNKAKYQPNRLAGTRIQIVPVSSRQSDLIAETFQMVESEKKAHFASRLHKYLADPKQYKAEVITTPDEQLLGLIVSFSSNASTVEIPILRLAEKTEMSSLASHLLFRTVRNAHSNNQTIVRLTDEFVSQDVKSALVENSFYKIGNTWCKLNIPGLKTIEAASAQLKSISPLFPNEKLLFDILKENLLIVQRENKPSNWLSFEKDCWPLKIQEAEVPIFLIPIQADWAVDLFDSELGKQTLLGSNSDLVLKMNNVYYRSAQTKLPTSPSRILWYVSRGKKKYPYSGDMSVRACSYVDKVIIGTPKELYKEFSELGVYNWENVYKTAKFNVEKNILAFRFSRTELFSTPIPLEQLKSFLGRKSAPMGPITITKKQFETLYKIGTH